MALQSKTPTDEAAKKRRDRDLLAQIFVGDNSLLSKLEKQLDMLVDTRQGGQMNFPKLNPMERREELREILKTFDEMRTQADLIIDPVINHGVKTRIIDMRGDLSEDSVVGDLSRMSLRIMTHESSLQSEVDVRMTLLPGNFLKDVEQRIKSISAKTDSLLSSYEKMPPQMNKVLSDLEKDWIRPALLVIDEALRGRVNFNDPDLNIKLSKAVGEIRKELNNEEFKKMTDELEPGLRYQVDEISRWADWLYKFVYNDERTLDILQDPYYWEEFIPRIA